MTVKCRKIAVIHQILDMLSAAQEHKLRYVTDYSSLFFSVFVTEVKVYFSSLTLLLHMVLDNCDFSPTSFFFMLNLDLLFLVVLFFFLKNYYYYNFFFCLGKRLSRRKWDTWFVKVVSRCSLRSHLGG